MYRLVARLNHLGVVEYKNQVERLSDGALVPFDEANIDYQEYLAWIADGNTPEECNLEVTQPDMEGEV